MQSIKLCVSELLFEADFSTLFVWRSCKTVVLSRGYICKFLLAHEHAMWQLKKSQKKVIRVEYFMKKSWTSSLV